MIGNLEHNLLLFTTHGRVTHAQSKNNICCEGTEMAILLFLWSFLTSSQKFSSQSFIHGLCANRGYETNNSYKVSFEPYKTILEIVVMAM